jgi:cyclic pyranopterin phosphate synthase
MVKVGAKPVQFRRAVAEAILNCAPATISALREQALPKGDALAVARVAGIQAAKKTADLIPLCHPLAPHFIGVEFVVQSRCVKIRCTVEIEAKTGVEMEALTGAGIAALTLYDMCKAIDKSMHVDGLRVLQKLKQ